MKTAILGGSFNPPHLAHLSLAETVRSIGYSRIIFVPTFRPPHKDLAAGADDTDRLAMLELAITGLEWAEIWDGEIRRGGKSYSIDTVRELKANGMISGRPGLVIGDDLLSGFGDWREAEKLATDAQIIVARRLSKSPAAVPSNFIQLENELIKCSSTMVRNRVSRGLSIRSLVPGPVADYIEKEALYVSPHR